MLDGFTRMVIIFKPDRCSAVQLSLARYCRMPGCQAAGFDFRQFDAQQLGENRVVAIPVPFAVQRN
jgi:hypothetical protein